MPDLEPRVIEVPNLDQSSYALLPALGAVNGLPIDDCRLGALGVWMGSAATGDSR